MEMDNRQFRSTGEGRMVGNTNRTTGDRTDEREKKHEMRPMRSRKRDSHCEYWNNYWNTEGKGHGLSQHSTYTRNENGIEKRENPQRGGTIDVGRATFSETKVVNKAVQLYNYGTMVG